MSAEFLPVENALAWAGVHGEERKPGMPLVKRLRAQPVDNVDADIANPEAARRGIRYIDKNLSFCLGEPGKYPDTYEGSLVPGILRRSAEYDLVAEFHRQNTDVRMNVAYVGSRIHPIALGFLALAGIDLVVVSEIGIVKHFPQAVLLDISPTYHKRKDGVGVAQNPNVAAFWRNKLHRAMREGVPRVSPKDFNFHAITDITPDEYRGLTAAHPSTPLGRPIPGAAALLGVERPVYELFRTEVIVPLQGHEITQSADGLYIAPTISTLRGEPPGTYRQQSHPAA